MTIYALSCHREDLQIEYLFSTAAKVGDFLVMLKQAEDNESWSIIPIELDTTNVKQVWWKKR
jgi:hypothetical protein